MVINVELVSPVNKQPAFPGLGLGFVDGSEILPAVKSIIFVKELFGAMVKEGEVQPAIATLQLLGVTVCARLIVVSKMTKKDSVCFIFSLIFTPFKRIRIYGINPMKTYLDTSYFRSIANKPRPEVFFC